MEAYVKRFSDFKTYAKLSISDYNVVLDSIYDEQSTFTASGEVDISTGDFLIFGDFIGYIFSVTPGEEKKTEIVCEGILKFFERALVYPGDGSYVEAFIASELTSNYKSETDTQYDMPYLSITHTDAESFIKPDIEDGMYSLKSYIAKGRRVKNVFVTFGISGDTLLVDIDAKTPASYNIVLGDGRHELVSNTISNSSVAKITTLQDDGLGGYTETDWYLNTNGSITTSPPATRVEGAWIGLHLDESVTAADEVANEFARNSHSHKIEFRSAKAYDFYSTVSIRVKDTVLQSYISSVRIDSADSRYLYRTGELAVTLSDKLKEMT